MRRPQPQLWPEPAPTCAETVSADVGGGEPVLVRCSKPAGHKPPCGRRIVWRKPRQRLFEPCDG